MANKTPLILDTATLQLAELPSGDNLDLTGSGISSVTNITLTGQINGPSNLIIDPAAVGDDTGTVEIKGNLTVQGTTTTINSTTVDLDHLSLGDNEVANFGTGNDLQIYHDGTNTTIANTTGDFYVTDSNGNIYIQAKAGEQSIVAFSDGAVDLYYNNTKRLETTSSGVAVTGSVSDSDGNVRSVPQNAKTSAYTLVATDNGKHISITTGGVTVPSGVFSIGDVVTIFNNSASNQNIVQGASVTLRQAGTANTGTRTLAQYGICTILCVASNTFAISGAGLS